MPSRAASIASMSEPFQRGTPTDEQIDQYLIDATDDQLLDVLWRTVSSSEASLQLLLAHIDTDTGSAHAALRAAVRDVTGSEG
jgi:hypothetical protein